MRLKALRLLGFKSFAQRTEFSFPDGITCIVGPNGCGKSNVVDAIRWVLGEQRPKALRGSEMADVIFSGTTRRRPLGMAEVALVFENSEGLLGLDYAEVEVCRRLYRDGSSEYLINKNRCRLRDLRELLMDTGSGPGAMTIMEQGRIDQILRDSHQERRQVFEEAAGVSKYKARRKETLRRLDRVEADLLRISDVVGERQRTVRSLKIQAGRAERYQGLLDEMRRKRLTLAVHRYAHLLREREGASARVSDLAGDEEAARTQVREAVEACRAVEQDVETSRTRASTLEAEIAKLEGRAETAREKSAFAARLASELDGKIRWYRGEIESSADRLLELSGLRKEVGEGLSRAEDERAARTEAVAAAQARIVEAAAEVEAFRTAEAGVASRARANLERQSEMASRRSRLEAESRALSEQTGRLEQRRGAVNDEIETCGQRLEAAEEARGTALLAEAEARASVEHGEERAHALELTVADVRERAGALDRDVSVCRSRAELLETLCARMEGVGDGAQRVIDAARDGAPQLTGVRGVLAELIDVDAADAAVVETALGPYATALVVDRFEDAERVAAYLARERLGRCLLVPLDHAAQRPGGAHAGPERRVLDLVRCGDEVRPAVASVLANAVAVADLAAARAARATDGTLRVVTAGGEVLDDLGVAAGGEPGGAGVLQRRTELRDLTERLERLLEESHAAQEELRRVHEEMAAARAEVSGGREALRQAEGESHRALADQERARADRDRLGEERDALGSELEDLVKALERQGAAILLAAEEARELEVQHQAFETERHAAAQAFRDEERVLRAAEADQADARVQLAAVVERCTALAARVGAVEAEVVDLESGVDEARTELEGCRGRRKDAEQRGKQAQEDLEAAQERREECVVELAEVRQRFEGVRGQLTERRTLVDELESAASGITGELQRFRLRENEARLRVENLIERIQEELDVELHAAWESRRDETHEDGTPVYAESDDGEELFDGAALEEEVAALKARIARMGPVNLEALGQLREAETEAAALLQQHDDLTRSRASLLEAIRRIDKESRELFTTTFEAIRSNFREMFRKLFGGGRADILLDEGQDILEAGIDIVAKPPGKELRSISLLSGGERTMTAVALLFSIYKAKPSPFCLLDEVDAALDESNIDRFVAVLTDFARESQFMIISHNKRTMGVADTIVGVSMPEAGVSQKIAVRLDQITEEGEIIAA